jgi:hypothetical protein
MKQVASKSLLGLFFYPEDGGETFLSHLSSLSMEYVALYHRVTVLDPQILQSTRYDFVFAVVSDSMRRSRK